MQQCLRRNAADVDAHAAELVSLDHGRGESQLRRTNGADIARGPAAYDDDVELCGHKILVVVEKRER
jgi:hypothetical protein